MTSLSPLASQTLKLVPIIFFFDFEFVPLYPGPKNPFFSGGSAGDTKLTNLHTYIKEILEAQIPPVLRGGDLPPPLKMNNVHLRYVLDLPEKLFIKKNKIGISFSLWDANGDKFVIFASSGPRDLENRIPC